MEFDVYMAASAHVAGKTRPVLALVAENVAPADLEAPDADQVENAIRQAAEDYGTGEGRYVAIPAGLAIEKDVRGRWRAVVRDPAVEPPA